MPKKEEQHICCLCNESRPQSKFYKSYSDLYSAHLLPICKDCFSRKFGQFSTEYKSSKMAMQRMCMAFDVYFDEDLFDSCDKNDGTTVGNYFRKLNMAQYRGKTFEDTIKGGFLSLSGDRKPVKQKRVAVVDEYGNEQSGLEDEINPRDVEKWGVGFDSTDYKILNGHYKLLTSSNPQSDSNREIFIIDLCYTKMQQMKAVREGRVDDYNKLTESYRKSFTQAGLKAVPDTSATDDLILGVTAETIEKYTPAEYYKDKKLFSDMDDIGGYFMRLVLRPLKNLQFGSKDRDTEHYVKEEGESNEYTDEEE